jgi:two-component system, OmpR family, sensor kinase
MLDSVRSRLALWHTAVLALVLVILSVTSYLWLKRAVDRRDDRFLEESASAFGANAVAERAEQPLDSAIAQTLAEFRLRKVAFLVYGPSGRLLGRSAPPPGREPDRGEPADPPLDTGEVRDALIGARRFAGPRYMSVGRGDGVYRLYRLPVSLGSERIVVVAAESLADRNELLEDTRAGFLVAIAVGLLLAWIGGYLLARRSLRPVVRMSHRAAAIGATSLGERLPVANPRDELGQLATAFNQLLARLDFEFDRQRRFMADASHELRTPVAIMRGEADIALSLDDRSPDEYRSALQVVRDEGRRLSRIVADLFLLARSDAGKQLLQPADLYLDELVADCVRSVRSLALARDITLHCDVDPPVSSHDGIETTGVAAHAYRGDEELLRRLLVNLLDNAIKHAPAGSIVDVRLVSDAIAHRIRVTDRGPGIARAAQPQIFERFYRANAAHVRDAGSESGGAGLGLAIARWVAEAHGGMLVLTSSVPGETVFEVTLRRLPNAG